jgi:hypothetical protein
MFKRIESVGVGIARAMEYLHNQNIIFQDLKPGKSNRRNLAFVGFLLLQMKANCTNNIDRIIRFSHQTLFYDTLQKILALRRRQTK